MANVFDLYGKISIDTSGFLTALSVAKKAITATTTAVTNFAKSSVATGQEFDKSMAQVAATMGKTVDEIQDLREFAQKMGSETAFSASQSADALNYMALAGYDAQTSMSMLPNVLNLAAAGGIDLAYASDMVTDTQSALGLSLQETTELVDKMAKGSSKTNTSVAQLGEAMLTVGGTAKMLAGGTTELSTALGLLADNGVKGSEGGTALRNIILSLAAPTDKAAGALEDLGIQVFDQQGNMRNLQSVFADFNSVLSAMTSGEQTQVLNTIFNKVDLKSVNALLATSTQRWKEVSVAIDDATGAAQQMAETQLDNLAGDITIFQSALEGIQIALSDKLTPSLRKFVQVGTNGLSNITNAFKKGGLKDAMAEFGKTISDGILLLMEMSPELLEAGGTILSAIGQGIIDNLPQILQIVMQLVKQIVIGLSEALPALAQALPEFIRTLMNIIDWSALLDLVMEVVKILGDTLIDVFPELTVAIVEFIEKIVAFVLEPTTLARLVEMSAQIVIAVSTALLAAAPKLLVGVGEIIKVVVDNIVKTDWTQLGKDLMNNITKALQKASAKLSEWWDGWSQEIGKYAVIAWDKVVEVWTPVGEWFGDRWEDIKNVFKVVGGWFKDVFTTAWYNIKNIFIVIGGWFSDRWIDIKSVFEFTGSWFKNIFTGAWDNIKNAFSNTKKFFEDVWSGIKNVFSTVGNWFKDTFTNAWNGIKSVFAPVGSVFQNIGDSILNGLKSIVNGLIWGINEIIRVPFDGLNGALRGIKGIDILGTKPFDWIGEIAIPQIPYLAKGGVLKKGQIAFLEGQGDEAIIPLSQNTEWLDKVAERLGENQQSVYYNFEIHIDKMGNTNAEDVEQFAEQLMEIMNEKTARRGYVMV